MKTLVLYYSKTGTTRKLAERLGKDLSADIAQIHCPRYEAGILSYMHAGWDSLRGGKPDIRVSQRVAGYDRVLLGCPIWTGYPAVPMRAFLDGNPDLPDDLSVFLTFGAQSPPEKALAMLRRLLPQGWKTVLLLQRDEVGSPVGNAKTKRFLDALQPEDRPPVNALQGA